MNNFVVSARKYRPATFDTVVGQLTITTTLKNAIKNNHLAQAFLFCGPRGVGKTTCARILAKTINCTSITADTESCNKCESCLTFNTGQSLNIFELDAASNNSVDDIRNLVEQVRFAPPNGLYKIYIIDEVHMLSAGAFNAFLKTLEEPPPYAIFILATTEKHKIIPTILSRCQIFDFSRIQIDDIAKHLAHIAQQENIVAEDDALHVIAQKAEGALRDALSMFDQMVTFSGNKVTYKDVIANLNILDYEYYFKVTDQIVPGNISQVLLTFAELINEGFDGHHFITGLSSHLRDLLVCKDESTLQLLEVTPGVREKYKQQSKAIDVASILKLIEICNRCDIEYKTAKNQRLHVEIALLKMCALAGKLVVNENAAPIAAVQVEKKTLIEKPVVVPAPVVEKIISPANTSAPAQVNEKKVEYTTSVPKIEPAALPETQPPLSSPKVDYGGRSQTSKTPSISAILKPNKKVIEEERPIEEKNNDAFDLQKLISVWKTFAEEMNAQKRKQLYTTLSSSVPELIDATTIQFTIANKVQEEDIRETRSELLSYLKEKLNNSFVDLKVVMTEKAPESERAYTTRDKFKKMTEKNPSLEKLRQQFDLDLDY